MLTEEDKAKIVGFYLKYKEDPKIIPKIEEKFDISKSTVYNVLKEKRVPKPTEVEKEQEFNHNNIDSFQETELDINLESSIDNFIIEKESLIEKFKQIKILSENDDINLANLVMYAQKKHNIDVKHFFEETLYGFIFNRELDKLQSNLKDIREHGYPIREQKETVESLVEQAQLKMTKDAIGDFREPESEVIIKREKQIKEEQETLMRSNLLISMLSYPKDLLKATIHFEFLKNMQSIPDLSMEYSKYYGKIMNLIDGLRRQGKLK